MSFYAQEQLVRERLNKLREEGQTNQMLYQEQTRQPTTRVFQRWWRWLTKPKVTYPKPQRKVQRR